MRPIRKMEATGGSTTHLDIIDKINELIDAINYLNDPRTPPHPPVHFKESENAIR